MKADAKNANLMHTKQSALKNAQKLVCYLFVPVERQNVVSVEILKRIEILDIVTHVIEYVKMNTVFAQEKQRNIGLENANVVTRLHRIATIFVQNAHQLGKEIILGEILKRKSSKEELMIKGDIQQTIILKYLHDKLLEMLCGVELLRNCLAKNVEVKIQKLIMMITQRHSMSDGFVKITT